MPRKIFSKFSPVAYNTGKYVNSFQVICKNWNCLHSIPDNLERIWTLWKVYRHTSNIPDSLGNFRTIWKVCKLKRLQTLWKLEKFQDTKKWFKILWMIWKISKQPVNFLDTRKDSRHSETVPVTQETLWKLLKLLKQLGNIPNSWKIFQALWRHSKNLVATILVKRSALANFSVWGYCVVQCG